MKFKIVLIILVTLSIFSYFYFSKGQIYNDLSNDRKTWHLRGKDHDQYIVKGKLTSELAILKSTSKELVKWCNYMINLDPEKYSNKKVSFELNVKTIQAVKGIRLFARTDSEDKMGSKFYMSPNWIKSENQFKKIKFDFEIPNNTTNLAFGINFSSNGEIYMKGFKIEYRNQ